MQLSEACKTEMQRLLPAVHLPARQMVNAMVSILVLIVDDPAERNGTPAGYPHEQAAVDSDRNSCCPGVRDTTGSEHVSATATASS